MPTFLEAMSSTPIYNPPRRPCEDCRVELPSGQVIAARLTKDEAVRLCNANPNRAFVWSMGAKMIVYRNWT